MNVSSAKMNIITQKHKEHKFGRVRLMTIAKQNGMEIIAQIKKWLKQSGVFFVGYQEGGVMPKTENVHTTVLAKALEMNGMSYEAIDITEQTYELLKKKRFAAIKHQNEFEAEGCSDWFNMLIGQTECATDSFEQFKEKMARYIYVIRK